MRRLALYRTFSKTNYTPDGCGAFLPSRISSLRLERARCHRDCSSPLNRIASVGQVAFDVAHRLFQRARHVGVCELILVLQKLALTHVEALGLNEVQ